MSKIINYLFIQKNNNAVLPQKKEFEMSLQLIFILILCWCDEQI